MRTAASVYSLDGGWDLALAVFSLVLITGGVTAMIKKTMRPVQSLAILATAVIVGGIALLATGFPITVVRVAIIATSTVGGIAIAAAIVTSPARKPGDS